MSMKFDLAAYRSKHFVETGTFHGGGVSRALQCGFETVDTIEVFEPLVQENSARFAAQIEAGMVRIHLGDSADLLGPAVAALPGRVTFWLDAHIQTMSGAGVGRQRCPVVAELEQIAQARPGRDDIILIDDLRLIEDRRAGWAVDLGELYRWIWTINPGFTLSRIEGHIPGDVLACVPGTRATPAT